MSNILFNASLLFVNLAVMLISLSADKIPVALFNAFTAGIVFANLIASFLRKDSSGWIE